MKAVTVCTRAMGLLFVLGLLLATPVAGQDANQKNADTAAGQSGDAQWIWSPAHAKDKIPVGDCFFRKSFQLKSPEMGEIQITADNQFKLFVNGQPAGQGNDWRQMQVFDVSEFLQQGRNTVAVQVTNIDAGSAGLVARVLVKEKSGTFRSYSTDASWKTSVRRFQRWTSPAFPEQEWVAAASYGTLGATLPWGDEIVFAGEGARFQIGAEFTIERLMRDEQVGSLIAMTFDAQGHILASQEGGPLLLLTDSDDNGTNDTVGVFCDQIKNVQGLLALGTRVFAVGDGPQGEALYRLRDADRDGVAEEIKSLVPMRGSKGEHGAHAIRLGPDGLLYVIIGDHARVGPRPDARSPYRYAYEGDLVRPRQQDPRGHAVGIPAPGGTVIRTDANGSFVELVAGGLRNSYDFAFSTDGELFTYDSDMEWDQGAPWYRPTRINHVIAGAELGWRSGWAKWPAYYLDSLPAALDLGRGSPTGVEFYNHTAFPERYRGAMFTCDWATGRIYCVRLERDGATYRATSEVFIQGRPLNATDIAVGPDGALYFCTGGRGTDGGVYRVRWTGQADSAATADLGPGIERALRQPQLDADWARAKIARVKRTLGDAWSQKLAAIAQDASRRLPDRLRSIDLMVFFGPKPSGELLLDLTSDNNAELRAKAARLMFACQNKACQDRLLALLEDEDPLVRRVACESLARVDAPVPAQPLVQLLGDKDRFVAFAAGRALQQLPTDQWAQLVLHDSRRRAFLQGSAFLLAARPDADTAREVLNRCDSLLVARSSLAGARLEASQFVNVLRVVQLALIHGQLSAEDVPTLGLTLLANYPSDNQGANRELVRLLVYLQTPGAAEKFAAQLQRDLPAEEKLHIGAYASRLKTGWDTDSKLALLKYYEEARSSDGGYSVSAYLENFARDFFTKLTLRERRHVLASGERWPTSALSVLAKLPADPGGEILDELRQLNQRIQPLCAESDTYRRLRVGILAVLGRSGEQASLDYLYSLYRDQPELRDPVAMSLTQHPDGESWSYLVDALQTVEGPVAREVLVALTQVPQRPKQSEPYRQAIMLGLRLGENGAEDALRLLDYWTNQQTAAANDPWQDRIATWQQWYAENYPDAPPAELPIDPAQDMWSYEELLAYLQSQAGRSGNPQRGEQTFATAQCIQCHRFRGRGEALGPDLTTVAKRFQKKEILASIVYPSLIVSDRYASRVVVSNGRSYTGLVVPRGQEGVTVLLSDGKKVELDHEDIDEIRPSRLSVMPAGLLNALSLEQIADLFAYLSQEKPADIAQRKPSRQR